MDEEKFFGPLTFRQFIYAVVGAGVIYFTFNNLSRNLSILISVLMAAATFALIRRAEPAPFTEETLRIKRSTLGREEFEKWCQRKIAMVQSQISVRESKGMVADPSLSKVKEFLEVAIREF